MTKAHIMVVEDERIVAADVQDRLRALGYGVTALVTSGEEAQQVAADSRPDLVLMDIMLKGQMDGIQAAEKISTELDIPVVFLTAHADETTLQRAKVTAPFGYILKPFDERELHTTIEIALYRHHTEAKIKKVERWLAAVLESIGEGVVATDKWGLVTFLNPVASTMTGWTAEDAVQQPFAEVVQLVDEVSRQPAESPISQVITEGVALHRRNNLLVSEEHADAVPVEYTAAPIRDDQGRIAGVVWVFRDLRLREAPSEERERLVAQLQVAMAEVGTLQGFLTVCRSCQKTALAAEAQAGIAEYIQAHPEIKTGLCPECARKEKTPGV